ncbi:IS30 family transposase [Pseudoalteromonas sp. S2755]|uniref:IS30 family transposase n=1 Tax=Pseudoalteromonas sp. S2755 TaxID=2066523 RepID=UPI0020168D00|nr:IS30 family transposase [Pseudoalteromonas sp. S2755]
MDPEQISGVSKIIGHPVSHEWIYAYIQNDKLSGGKRVTIPNRVSIEHRPAIVDTKTRFGDWEVDTVLAKHSTGAIASLVERTSKFYLIRKVPAKSAAQVSRAMIGMLWRYRRHVHTVTADNVLSLILCSFYFSVN